MPFSVAYKSNILLLLQYKHVAPTVSVQVEYKHVAPTVSVQVEYKHEAPTVSVQVVTSTHLYLYKLVLVQTYTC